MNINEKKARRANAGFTLVELLLVVAILGVLAAVAMVNTQGIGKESRINATRMTIASIEKAAQAYEIRHSKFPDSLEQLMQSDGDRPPLLDAKARADSFGNAFAYKKTTHSIEIRSAGPDGQMNNEDDIINAETK